MKKVVFILGPTAVGKSQMGVFLAKKFNGEIISADSVQIYRGLDIGSAKVTKEEMQGVVHHGIDILEPDQDFSVHDFVEYTKKKIDEIVLRGHLPIVVGGTGLYIKALVEGYTLGGTGRDEKLRQELEQLAREKGNDALFEMLRQKDEKMALQTDKFNTVRLIRALEIALNNGEKATQKNEIEPLLIGLVRERDALYKDINLRVDKMLENGLIKEVETLKNQNLENKQCMRAIGYKEALQFLRGEIDFQQMTELIKQHSRNYAKRQFTFMRSMKNLVMIDVEDRNLAQNKIIDLVGEFLK